MKRQEKIVGFVSFARRVALAMTLLGAGVALTPTAVRAQSESAGAGVSARGPHREALVSERQQLRLKLDRINAEIAGLKRQDRSLRDDYRLRAKMADAEALARRLTRLDAQLGATQRSPSGATDTALAGESSSQDRLGGASTGAGADAATIAPVVAPTAKATDDRVALEAKADILADQSRRVGGQATRLAQRIASVRARQELKKRSGQLERDPFSPLEQARRRVAIGTGAPTNASNTFGTPGSSRGAGDATTSTPPPGGTSTPTVGGTTGDGRTGITTTGTPTRPETVSPPAPVGSTTPETPGSVAAQFRGLLDSATLAEIRRIESPGSSASNLEAMEKALAALRARAAQLDDEARTLRQRARTSAP